MAYDKNTPEIGPYVPIDEFIKRVEAAEFKSGSSVPEKTPSPRSPAKDVPKPEASPRKKELSSGDDFYLYSDSCKAPVKVGKYFVGNKGQRYVRLTPYGRNFIYFNESSSGFKCEIDVDSQSLAWKHDENGRRVALTPQQKAYRDGYIARGHDEYKLWKRSGKRGNK